jgi:hypothetical protein
MATHLDLSDQHGEILAELYSDCNATLDDLPYTDAFEQLYSQFLLRAGVTLDRHGLWRALSNARKAGKLARKARA